MTTPPAKCALRGGPCHGMTFDWDDPPAAVKMARQRGAWLAIFPDDPDGVPAGADVVLDYERQGEGDGWLVNYAIATPRPTETGREG